VSASKQMREMRPVHFSGTNGARIECDCGCGKTFVPTRSWQRFYSTECRKRSWKFGRVSLKQFTGLEIRVKRIEAKLGIGKEGS